jgi:HPt (histidine-containing phosphotransfer) domain-containing protein
MILAEGKGCLLPDSVQNTVDWTAFAQARRDLGDGFVRLLSYFREDGAKAIAAIEGAVRQGQAAPIVLPAHKLKSEAREFGAVALAALAEDIELSARDCVEWRQNPADLVEQVVALRPLYEATVQAIDEATNPLKSRRPAFGAASR